MLYDLWGYLSIALSQVPSSYFFYNFISPNIHFGLPWWVVKNLLATRETQVWSLGWENPTQEDVAIHFSILAWRIPWTKEPVGLQSMGSQRVGHNWATNTTQHNTFSCFLTFSLWMSIFITFLMFWVKTHLFNSLF